MDDAALEQPVSQKRSRLLTAVLVALVVAVCLQGATMWRMHDKLEQALASTNPNTSDDGWTVIPRPDSTQPNEPDPQSGNQNQTTADSQSQLIDPMTWDPFQEMERMQQEMDRLFNKSFQRFQGSPRYGNLATTITMSPNFDLTEDKNHYVVKIDMPGSDQSDINAKIENQTLTVTGKRDQTVQQHKDGRVLRQERVSGTFQRSMVLPGPVDDAGMKSSYENGVLTITIPKAKPANPKSSIPLQ